MVSGENPNRLAGGAAIGAFFMWGVLPIYWKLLGDIDAFDIVCHRVIWSTVMLTAILYAGGEFKVLRAQLTSASFWKSCVPASFLIASNWLLFIWAVKNEHVIDTSLGYFLTPLLNIFLAIVFLGESVNRWQAAAIMLATCGIIYSFQAEGVFPYVAIILATTFSLYSLVKKRSILLPISGLFVETLIMTPLAFGWLVWGSRSSISSVSGIDWAMLVFAGPMTTIPLLLFAYAAPRISLITMGMFQFLAPSICLMIGMYYEAMPLSRWIAFVLVWVSLAIYMTDQALRRRAIRQNAANCDDQPIPEPVPALAILSSEPVR
jgi:chloramphenicol-sensitive protein RarD